MKAIISLLMCAGIASATSLKRFENWSCNFPNQKVTGPIEGQAVQIKFDVFSGKGTALSYPICKVCMIRPQEIAIERDVTREFIVYKNQLASFNLRVSWTTVPMPGAGFPASLDRKTGICFSK